jgi:hypothetical protein
VELTVAIEDLDSKQDLMRFIVEQVEEEPLPPSAIGGLQTLVTPGKWNPLTLLNGWSNVGAGWRQAAYRSIPGNGVQVAGLIQKATAPLGTICAKLPASVAPKEHLQFGGNNANAFALLKLLNDGSIFVYAAEPATEVSLASIVYWSGA